MLVTIRFVISPMVLLSNKYMLQWGKHTLAKANTAETVKIPTAYTSKLYQVQATLQRNTAHTGSGVSNVYAYPSSTTQIILVEDYSGNSTTIAMMYMTIGV